MSIFQRKPTTDDPQPLALPPPPEETIERDIAAVLQFAQPAHRAALELPGYVQHNVEVGEVGKTAAANVIAEYEKTAQQIEAMGEELKRTALRGAEILAEMQACIEYIGETAAKYREQGKNVFDEIEQKSLLAQNVRRVCEDLRTQLGEKP